MSSFRADIDQLPEIAETVERIGDAVHVSVMRAKARWGTVSSPESDEKFFMAGFALGLAKAGRGDLLSSYPAARKHAIQLGLLREDGTPVNL